MRFLFVLFVFLVGWTGIFGQSLNDYRSNGSGNWTTVGVWQRYNGTAWVAATSYPGQLAGTNDVTILGGDVIVLDSDVPQSFNTLTIGDNAGGVDRLEIDADASLNINELIITGTGEVEWTSNKTTLSLPGGVIVTLENGGVFVTDNPCNANKILSIGGVNYASCNGGGGGIDYEFDDINNGGGTLQVVPSSNSPICSGDTLNLFANPAGQKPSETYTFAWTATGPGGYTFSSSVENPVITSSLTAGTYIYEVTITDDSNATYTFTNDTEVIVSVIPSAPISGGNQTVACGGSISALTATVGGGETVDWYDASTAGTLLLSGNTSYTPSSAGSYFAEARNTTVGCISTTRTEIILTIGPCVTTVITNRRLTYRVKN